MTKLYIRKNRNNNQRKALKNTERNSIAKSVNDNKPQTPQNSHRHSDAVSIQSQHAKPLFLSVHMLTIAEVQ